MNIQENILYEDNELLVCRKPAGIAVQTARIAQMDMESLLKNYLAEEKRKEQKGEGHVTGSFVTGHSASGRKNMSAVKPGENHRNINQPYLAVIHRLDQPVSGVLVFAKTAFAAKELNKQITNHTMGKYYLAEVDGVIPKETDTLTDYLLKDAKTNTSRVVPKGTPGAKEATLHYRKKDNTHLEIELVTGRHHQIRVQLSHAGMPIAGDGKYNPNPGKESRLQLCAYRLEFRHPKTGKKMTFLY